MKTGKYSKPEMYAIIGQWEKSGLSQKAFCKTVSINYYTFKYWLAKKSNEEQEIQHNHTGQKEIRKAFIPVEVPIAKDIFPGIQLDYPNGVILKITEGMPIEQVQQLIKLY